MLGLVRKRHEGDGWLVFSELANKPGGHDRYADAFALGVWASTKYEAHLYEFKASRTDVRRELRDPTKAEGVGKYATYWWLAVTDVKIIADLVIPEAWGIVTPEVRGGHRLLKVVRKAPKLKPSPFSPLFAVSLVRNMAKMYKSNADYERMREERDAALDKRDIKPPADVAAKDAEIRSLNQELFQLRQGLDSFKAESGVDLNRPDLRQWEMGNIGRELEVAKLLHGRLVRGELHSEVVKLATAARTMEMSAAELAEAAVALRALLPPGEHTSHCQRRSSWAGSNANCSCGLLPLSDAERKISGDAESDATIPEDAHQAPFVPSIEG